MTSSLRNSLHRRNHKERAQLVGRKKLGLLEKHKDYVQRAKNFHSKQDRIKRLKVKAADRNKDEFYFGMKNAKTSKGVHVQSRGNQALPTDMVKVLKSQDANYIRTVRNAGRKRIAALQDKLKTLADLVKSPFSSNELEENNSDSALEEQLETFHDAGILAAEGPVGKGRKKLPKHIVFVEDEDQVRAYQPPSARISVPEVRDAQSPDEMELGWVSTSSTRKGKQVAKVDEERLTANIDETERQSQSKEMRSAIIKELSARLTRDTALRHTERELQMQTIMMGKGARRKVSAPELVDGSKEPESDEDEFSYGKRRPHASRNEEPVYKPRVYKWKQERKK